MRDDFPLADGFVISCPAMVAGSSPVREIRKRGNIPLVLQDDVVVEMKRSDLVASWRSTCALARGKADSLMKLTALRISDALADEDSCDIESLAEDMAAFFLLAVRNKGMDVQVATRYCAVSWKEQASEPLSVQRF